MLTSLFIHISQFVGKLIYIYCNVKFVALLSNHFYRSKTSKNIVMCLLVLLLKDIDGGSDEVGYHKMMMDY